jgi:hypothetical protein
VFKYQISVKTIHFFQTGVVGENVHINCAAISIPESKEVYWKYHGEAIDDGKSASFE